MWNSRAVAIYKRISLHLFVVFVVVIIVVDVVIVISILCMTKRHSVAFALSLIIHTHTHTERLAIASRTYEDHFTRTITLICKKKKPIYSCARRLRLQLNMIIL